jgi:hypothetical protein
MFFILVSSLILLPSCLGTSVKREWAFSREFQPRLYFRLAVIDTDPQFQISSYVEAELLRKGYQVRDAFTVREALKTVISKDQPFNPEILEKMGRLLDVQGIVLCSVLEFSRFRDAYRLNIKMVNPQNGYTLWSAHGYAEGKKGQKPADLLREIVASSLKDLPAAP